MAKTPRIIRVLALISLGAVIGAGTFYFTIGKRWKEERDDAIMLESGWLVNQASLLREGKSEGVRRMQEDMLVLNLQIIGRQLRHHPGALYWMEYIERYFVSNGVPLPAEGVNLMHEARRELKPSGRVVYRQ